MTLDASAYKSTRVGLFTYFFGICGAVLTLAGVLPATLICLAADLQVSVHDTIFLVVILLLVFSLSGFAGQLLCFSIPPETDARLFLSIAVALRLAAIAMNVFVTQSVGNMIPSIAALSFFPSLLSNICFLLFLKQVTRYLNEPAVELRVTRFFAFVFALIILLALCIGIQTMLISLPGNQSLSSAIGLVLGCFLVFARIALTISYAGLVLDTARALPPINVRRTPDARLLAIPCGSD
ncbi:hypothetical protein [Stieleria maiorica]|uniref:hypothetical protein n=1 Tax=Stieleria maiorica TaxID=2795974 RepID=UPI0011C8C02F|nr:hypothetical protein [Stieleria maiorica]